MPEDQTGEERSIHPEIEKAAISRVLALANEIKDEVENNPATRSLREIDLSTPEVDFPDENSPTTQALERGAARIRQFISPAGGFSNEVDKFEIFFNDPNIKDPNGNNLRLRFSYLPVPTAPGGSDLIEKYAEKGTFFHYLLFVQSNNENSQQLAVEQFKKTYNREPIEPEHIYTEFYFGSVPDENEIVKIFDVEETTIRPEFATPPETPTERLIQAIWPAGERSRKTTPVESKKTPEDYEFLATTLTSILNKVKSFGAPQTPQTPEP